MYIFVRTSYVITHDLSVIKCFCSIQFKLPKQPTFLQCLERFIIQEIWPVNIEILYELRHEKTIFLPLRKQRRRSASQ